jgi:hypothetical protein
MAFASRVSPLEPIEIYPYRSSFALMAGGVDKLTIGCAARTRARLFEDHVVSPYSAIAVSQTVVVQSVDATLVGVKVQEH